MLQLQRRISRYGELQRRVLLLLSINSRYDLNIPLVMPHWCHLWVGGLKGGIKAQEVMRLVQPVFYSSCVFDRYEQTSKAPDQPSETMRSKASKRLPVRTQRQPTFSSYVAPGSTNPSYAAQGSTNPSYAGQGSGSTAPSYPPAASNTPRCSVCNGVEWVEDQRGDYWEPCPKCQWSSPRSERTTEWSSHQTTPTLYNSRAGGSNFNRAGGRHNDKGADGASAYHTDVGGVNFINSPLPRKLVRTILPDTTTNGQALDNVTRNSASMYCTTLC